VAKVRDWDSKESMVWMQGHGWFRYVRLTSKAGLDGVAYFKTSNLERINKDS